MKEIDIEKYKTAWKNEQSFDNKRLSDSEIKNFLQANSKSIDKLFRVGLSIDIAFKSVLACSFVGLIVLFSNQYNVVLINVLLILLSILSIVSHYLTFRKIPRAQDHLLNIRESLKTKINFYNTRYIKSILLAALSNSMFFLSGIMYYFYFKYGEIRSFQLDDYLVFGGAIVLSFVFGAFIQLKQHNFQIKQLESCLHDIDEDTLKVYKVKKHKNERNRNIIIAIISLLAGLFLLTYFIFR